MRVDISTLDDSISSGVCLRPIYFDGRFCGDFKSSEIGRPCSYLYQYVLGDDTLGDFMCGLFGVIPLNKSNENVISESVLRCEKCINAIGRWKW